MKEDADLEEGYSEQWQLMIELSCLAVVLYQKEFISPVDNEEVQEADKVQDWHATRVSHNGPQGSEVLSIHEICLDLRTSVESIEI